MATESRGSAHDSTGGRLTTAATVAALALVAFALRVFASYRAVLGREYVAFTESDAWYHMRLVDGLIRTFPRRIWHDAYLIHPGGDVVNAGPMFDWIVAGVALLLGGGDPAPRLVDLVGAFTPPVFGAVTVIAVFALAREVFSERAGLWAAVAAAVMPGALFDRSVLGFTDHHCAEVLFTTLALLFFVRAVDGGRSARSRMGQAAAAGLFLATYLLTWSGGAVVVAIVAGWASAEIVWARLRGREAGLVARAVAIAFVVAAVLVSPWIGIRPFFTYDAIALGGGAATALALAALARATQALTRGRVVFAAAVTLSAGLGAALLFVLQGLSLEGLRDEVARLSPLRTGVIVREALPLMRSDAWGPVPLWREFTTSLLLALLALPATIWSARGSAPRLRLLLAWGGTSLAMTFGQVRFAYYLAVPVAVLAGHGADRLLSWLARPDGHGDSAGETHGRRAPAGILLALVLGAAVAAPGLPSIVEASRRESSVPPEWFDALQWLRTNTPEPFADPNAYYTGAGANGYGVLAWWDFGYWITRIGRRVPTTNPRQSGIREAVDFYLAADPAEAREAIRQAGVRYVIADWSLAASIDRVPRAWTGLFDAVVRAAGRTPDDYCGMFRTGDDPEPVMYCYPEYYRTMAVRLYLFGGDETPASSIWVLETTPAEDGTELVLEEHSFATYEDAAAFAAAPSAAPGVRRRLVSKVPWESCVPLEALEGYESAYRSLSRQQLTASSVGPSVVQIYDVGEGR